MQKFFFLVFSNLFITTVFSQENPHGNAFDISCNTCHTSSKWNDVSQNTFDHDQTAFILFGAHKKVKCTSCHSSLKFDDKQSSCFECHTDIHKNEFGNACAECHSEQGWDDRSAFMLFHNQTDFPLNGAHAMIDCESCHLHEQQRQYVNTPAECSACHLDVFMTTLNPDHQKAGFDLDCQNCHLTKSNGWKKSIFSHSNIFPLTGGHGGLDCEECHGINYEISKVVCLDCHQSDYDATINPVHVAFLFSTDCEECHTGIKWTRTLFSHFAVSGFAVEGRHKEIYCTECHENNQLSGIPDECVDCHRQEYDSADDPNHLAALFPTTCQDCHSAIRWDDAKWNHDNDYFPIYSGKHREAWDDCTNCHVNPTNYAQFECIFCHEHRQNEMDDKHRNRRNYVYESQACFACHPKGRE